MLFLGGVPYFACAALFRNYATMSTPLCDSHRNHFRWQSAIFWGGLAIIATLLIGCFAMIPHMPDKILQNCFAGTGIFALLWVIAYVINNFVSVTAAKVDDHEILLVGVADRFANACNRRSSDYVDEVEEASHFQFARR
jgi:membrane-anchored glycerophosphoryl diester phosphodiesterase (GDPDase)